jgi:hypothetical protein
VPSSRPASQRIENDRLVYLVELHGDDGWLVLTRPPATALGIPDTPAVREQEIRFHAERLGRELTEDEQSSSEATLVSKARRRQRAFGGAWEDVMRLAMLVRDGELLDGGVSPEQVLEDLGCSPVQIERMTGTPAPAPVRTVAEGASHD